MSETDARPLDAEDFDRLAPAAAQALLRPVCASQAWQDEMVARRPFDSLAAALAASDDVLAGLSWPQLEQALAAHPRIGERAAGASTEAAWSRAEQGPAGTPDVEQRLVAGNVAYEERFGHVFLICASGLSREQLLAALQERLGHDAAQERDTTRRELAAIVALRLQKVIA